MSEELIASALYAYLATASQKGGSNRHFFQLNGFDDLTYKSFLARLNSEGDRLAGRTAMIRTTASIPGFEQYAVEQDKSAAWYRNTVQKNHVLILILNSRTSEAQSLQDIF